MSTTHARRNLQGRKLGILLSTKPEHPNLETCLGLSRAALARGGDVYLYMIDDGVAAIDDDRILDLGRRGAKLFVCAYGCQRRRLPITDKATYCGLVVLTDLINGCDRFVALNSSTADGRVVAAEHVLVVVSADPETSHRANEAIRIALGIIAGENDVTLALLGPSAKVLDAEVEDYVDGEDILKHVSTLKKLGQPFHVERDVIPRDGDWNREGITIVPIARDELASLIAKSDRVLVF